MTQRYPNCGGGWSDLLERACIRIESALARRDTFNVLQINERCGTLRFYWGGKLSASSKAKIFDAVALAEARSCCTCELCGEEGRLYRAGSVLLTRCVVHARGSLVKIEPRFENVHLVQQVIRNEPKIAVCRYDRITDAFFQILPGALGTEERSDADFVCTASDQNFEAQDLKLLSAVECEFRDLGGHADRKILLPQTKARKW